LDKIVALVGKRDEPTDGVADYCSSLRGALRPYGCELELFQVRWAEHGWSAALAELRENAKEWCGCWILLHYTTLAWSRRGFPWRVPEVLSAVRERGVRCGVVFHDFGPFISAGIVGSIRKVCHLQVLHRLYKQADRAIFTVPVDKATWLPLHHDKAAHIPVGANCPELPLVSPPHPSDTLTVAVYCVTSGNRMTQEVSDIGYAVKSARAAAGRLRLVVLGRGSQEADSALRSEFAGTDVDLETLGLLSPEDVTRALARADVLLFVRGHISSRRGSAIAGIACGLPVVGCAGAETAWPVTEAGVLLVPEGNREALSVALARVLSDSALRQALRERSRRAQAQYFSWPAIATCLLGALEDSTDAPSVGTGVETPDATRTKSSTGADTGT
jgi:glycosyltransferase involved in cell wall biosynthesis